MSANPFVAFWQDPVTTLTTLAYVLLLLGATIALAGLAWNWILHLSNVWEFRHNPNKFGPEWELVPPTGAIGRVAALCFLGAVEALLLGGVVFVLS